MLKQISLRFGFNTRSVGLFLCMLMAMYGHLSHVYAIQEELLSLDRGDAQLLDQEVPADAIPEKGITEKFDSWVDTIARPIPLYHDQVTAKFSGQLMHRFEYWNNYNFDSTTYEDDPFNLLRSRLGMELDVKPLLAKGFIQIQDARNWAYQRQHKGKFHENVFDFHQFYGEFKSPWEKIPVTVKVGRQKLSYGDERFVSAYEGFNIARSFDAVKVMYTPLTWFKADLWYSQTVKIKPEKIDTGNHKENFYGLYTTLGPHKEHLLDTFLFVRQNKNKEIVGEYPGQIGELKEYTVGNRFKGKKGNFHYGTEWASQFGSRAHNDIVAWAWHNDIGYNFNSVPFQPHIQFDYNHASGNNQQDGKYRTFDDLFGSTYLNYGFMDFVTLMNINHFRGTIDARPLKKVTVAAAYNWAYLDSSSDSWYMGIDYINRPGQSGAPRFVGQELDLYAMYDISRYVHFFIGFYRFFAGTFVKATGPHDDASNLFVQTMFEF